MTPPHFAISLSQVALCTILATRISTLGYLFTLELM
nr:MAG TPA: hypothetical protein [Caudoviricetes sp.]